MARKRRTTQYTPMPPQVPRGRPTPASRAPVVGLVPSEAEAPAMLEAQYAFVRRDLLRIAVLAATMFALIYASTFVLR